MRRKELQQHLETFLVTHMYLQVDFDKKMKSEQMGLVKEVRLLNDKLSRTEERLVSAERNMIHLETRQDILETDRKERHSER